MHHHGGHPRRSGGEVRTVVARGSQTAGTIYGVLPGTCRRASGWGKGRIWSCELQKLLLRKRS